MLGIGDLIFQILYGIPLVTLYIFIVIQILTPSLNTQLKSPFFKLATVIGFVDLTDYLVVWIMYKLPSCPQTVGIYKGQQENYFITLCGFFAYYLPLVRSYLLLLSCVNRFTVLHNFSWQERIWSIYWKYFVSCSFFVAIITVFPTLDGEIFYVPYETIVMIAVKAEWDPFSRSFINACIVSGIAVLSFCFNLGALLSLISKKRSITFVRSEIHKAEIGLLVISCFDICIDVTYGVQQILIFLSSNGTIRNPYTIVAIYDSYSWIRDLNNLSRPIFFVISCKAIRETFLFLIGCKKLNKSNIIFINSNITVNI